jgi:hypothetical protein
VASYQADQPLSNFNKDDSSFGYSLLAMENDQSDSRSGFMTQFAITITGTPQVDACADLLRLKCKSGCASAL